ncbi:MAG: CoA ester lyase [Hyphomicrobiales bacterium]|nr:MAG: CoA ester lyase [Hyphomicrobiales bacterium]
MSEQLRPRRSVLYMPGSNTRALEKAKTLDADCLILDLEDAVAPEEKAQARKNVFDAVRGGGYGNRELIIRINAITSAWGEADLEIAVSANPDAILAPKVSTAADVFEIGQRLDSAGAEASLKLWVMMETPRAMLHAEEIAAAVNGPDGRRLKAFVMGTNDLAKDTRARILPGRQPMVSWLSTCVAAARAYGLDIIDGVYNDFGNEEGFAEECAQGRDFGMDGKTLIHPKQVAPCNEIFAPSADEVAWAKTIIAAFDEPENAGKGAIRIEGKMVELLHADMARRTVAVAEAMAARAGA